MGNPAATVSNRRFPPAVAAAGVVVLIHYLWLLVEIGGPRTTQAFSNLILVPIPIAAAAACWAAARRASGRTRRGWMLLSAAVASWALGRAAWSYYELVGGVDVPFPSMADVGYLVLIPLAGAAMLSFPAMPRGAIPRAKLILDALILSSCLLFVSWVTVLGPVAAEAGGSLFARGLALAYPVGDIVLLVFVLIAASRSTGVARVSLLFIGAGLASLAIAHSSFTYLYYVDEYSSGALVDYVWTLGFLLVALGAYGASKMEAPSAEPQYAGTTLSAALPALAVLFPVTIASIEFAFSGELEPFLLWNAFAIIMLVVGNQLVSAFENRGTAVRLEAEVHERTAELADAVQRLGESRQMQDEFVSNATHELRTPLTVIVGAIDALDSTSEDLPPEFGSMVNLARRGARNMTRLVDDLLLASGIAGSVPTQRIPFDAATHMEIALANFDPGARYVARDFPNAMPAVGDALRFEAAVGHVLENAKKFSPDGSTITVAGSSDDEAVVFTVTDEGPGVPTDMRDAVFDRFYQADGSTTRRFGGLGLGLFLARELMRGMNGEVTIEDSDRGCRMRMELAAVTASDRSRPAVH